MYRRKNDEKDQIANVVFLTVNDVYDLYPNEQGRGGIAELATLLEREKMALQKEIKVFLTLNGDFLSGSEIGEKYKGAHMIELMNALGIEYVVLGNHEFDFGAQVLKQRMKESNFKWFGSNILEKTIGKDEKNDSFSLKLFENVMDYEIIELQDGLKMGFFGICTEETPHLSYPGDNVIFEDVFKTSKRCVTELKEKGVDFIVVLTHLSLEQDRALARKVKGIDVIIGGHDHDPFTFMEGKTFIHKSGQNAFWLGKLEFSLYRSGGTSAIVTSNPLTPVFISTQWSMISNQFISPHLRVQQIVQKYMLSMEKEENALENVRVLCTLALPLSTRTAQLRSNESNAGNLIADAIRSELNADFGLINGGFIRGDKIYQAKTNLTIGILNREMPFPRPAVLVRIQARDFQEAILQHLSKYPQLSGSYPHISGLKIVYDASKKKLIEFKNESGQEIDLNAFVLVATSKFVCEGGDGCISWIKGEVIRIADKIPSVVAEYLMKKRLISYPEQEGRLQILE